MATLLTIAWRNLRRNTRRSLLTGATIFLAVFLALVMRSMQKGSYAAMIEASVAYTGHIQIHGAGYWKHKSINRSFAYTERLRSALEELSNVAVAVPRLESFALVSHGDRTKGVALIGVEPSLEDRTTHLARRVVKGAYLDQDAPGVLLTERIADYLEVSVGDSIVVLGQGYHGVTAAGELPVCGILHFLSAEQQAGLVYLPLSAAQSLFGTPPDQLTSLSLMLRDPSRLDETRREILERPGDGVEAMSWKEISVDMVQQIQSDNAGGIFMLILLYVIVGFGMLGTVLMSTMERQRELGVMNALGMRKSRLSLVLLLETVLLGLLGVLTGMIASLPVLIYFHLHPIPVSGSVAKLFEEFNAPPYLPFSLEPAVFLHQGVTVFILTLVAFAYPLVYVHRMRIMNAITGR